MALGDTLQKYVVSTNLTITLGSLAQDASLLTGRHSTYVSNLTNKYSDFLLSGVLRTSTAPTVGSFIEVWVYAPLSCTDLAVPTFTWPNTITGVDGGITLQAGVKDFALKNAATIVIPVATDNLYYPFGPVSVRSLFGGVLPQAWGAFVTHNLGSAKTLHASGSVLTYSPVYNNTVLAA